jgi:hypothetical protein
MRMMKVINLMMITKMMTMTMIKIMMKTMMIMMMTMTMKMKKKNWMMSICLFMKLNRMMMKSYYCKDKRRSKICLLKKRKKILMNRSLLD